MRTAFFVDGYNLYYGALHASPYKWLDLPKLLKTILHIQDPTATVASIAYYTAPVIARLATRGQASNDAQSRYIRALQARDVEVTLGSHRLAPSFAPRYVDGQKASRTDRVPIWLLEEKQTDVNVALGMYRTACRAEQLGIDQIVLVSGDTDLAPALAAIRGDFPQMHLGVILPHRGERSEIVREPPGSLQKHADWMRRYISDEEMEACQLPPKVPLPRKPAIVKPDYW
ncbi:MULTISPECIES: NYN domain-containing protein [Pseudomonadaceae]|uniref:NYN domain-containing protein n=2 Tax=Pseudomonadaceae TaxID=135621 RepID=A0A2N8R973_STUST|nr:MULTISPECIES: NYN domain-containing protein [Pseudomonadaceae]MCQ4256271.1 NYN domain-containing protein [Stutzerimonas stutzeri]MDC3951708.1 NYN domain-containing protein [Pseudomonas aeruginosa]PNF57630.1 NYN domain-containing protein [Stutzerimonas stutzeri]TRO07527.1 NYN domain-containing protein [Pseudomonas mendocina]TRO10676.1 NYN domain-containing protein [Pseudomonas mendocina]